MVNTGVLSPIQFNLKQGKVHLKSHRAESGGGREICMCLGQYSEMFMFLWHMAKHAKK